MFSFKYKLLGLFLLLTFVLLSSCSSNQATQAPPTEPPPTDTLVIPTATNPPPTSTPVPTETPTPEPSSTIAPTDTAIPTDTATPTLTATATATATPPPDQAILPGGAIMLYYILPDTGGPIACGDSLVTAYSGLVKSGDIKKDVTAALNRLFSIGTKKVGELSNPLYQSKLRVSSISYNKNDNQLLVHLTGGFVKPKEDCDQLRYRWQVWSTIRQFGVKNVIVWAGDQLLGDLLAANDK